MGIDLEALANDLRAAGISCQKMWREHPEPNGWSLVIGNAGDALSWVYDDGWFTLSADDIEPPTLAIIARHLGAGQPVAADRSALVETVLRVMGECQRENFEPGSVWPEDAERVVAAVEAAGWGPRADPVAGTGETLYRVCRECNADGTRKVWEGGDDVCRACKGRGYVPVAPPEPLSAEERDRLAKAALDAAAYDSLDDPWCTDENDCSGPVEWDNARELWRENGRQIASAVLAELPARFRVPVEGA